MEKDRILPMEAPERNTLRVLLAEFLLYCTNHVVNRIPFRAVRHGYYRILYGLALDPDSSVFLGVTFTTRGRFSLGRASTINARCHLDNRGGIAIGRGVTLGPEVMVLTADHDVHSRRLLGRLRPVEIGDRVFIGARALILPGVRIGSRAVVGAGAVVTRDVPDGTMVAGVPARPVGRIEVEWEQEGAYWRWFQ